MTPKPESETDPSPVPNLIAALDAGTATPELISEWANHPYVCTTDIIRRAIAALMAARAATEARHQQEIATLTAERDREHQIREQAESDLMAQIDNSVALAATVQRVEAERDAKSRLIAELEGEAKVGGPSTRRGTGQRAGTVKPARAW